MPARSQTPETFTLPDGAIITSRETIQLGSLASRIPGKSTVLSSGVKRKLKIVFGNDFGIGREEMENLLRGLSSEVQKKILRGYFFGLLGKEGFNIRHSELENKIAAFPEENWTNDDWAVFGDLALKPASKNRNVIIKSSSSGKTLKNSSFRDIQAVFTGNYDEADGRGHR